jgi:hypothetical protein
MFLKIVRVLVIALLLITTLLTPHRTHACSCAIGSYAGVRESTEVIFLGTVVRVRESGTLTHFTFRVHHDWKGTGEEYVQVQSSSSGTSCGTYFNLSDMYVVYAYEGDAELVTTRCTLNHSASSTSVHRRIVSKVRQEIRVALGFEAREQWELDY